MSRDKETAASPTRHERRSGKRWWHILLLTALLVPLAVLTIFAASPERFLNRVEGGPLPEVSARAASIHASTLIVDLHADSLLFGRDLSQRGDTGHVDLPRLRENFDLRRV